jgi:hypothetical protein
MTTPRRVMQDVRRRLSTYQEDVSDSWRQIVSPRLANLGLLNVTTTRGSLATQFDFADEAFRQEVLDMAAAADASADEAASTAAVPGDNDQQDVLQDVPQESLPPVMLGGIALDLSDTAQANFDLTVGKLYDQTKRSQLTPDQHTEFRLNATRKILRKPLNTLSITSADEEALEKVFNLDSQLTTLRDHCRLFDFDNVYNVQKPIDSRTSKRVHPGTWNIFDDFVTLSAPVVANWMIYLHTWCTTTSVRENVSLALAFIKANTEDSLYNKCLPEYLKYPLEAQGGPLMTILIFKKIQLTTESALTNLVNRIRSIKISTIEGENVETVVNMVNAALKLIRRGEQQNMIRLPFDFPKTLLEIYQTTSVPEFNSQFQRQLQIAQEAQDLYGGTAQWPSIDQINNLAKNSYERLVNDSKWNVPATTKAYTARGKDKGKTTGAYNANLQANPPLRPPPICWNCEGPHHLKDCTQPHNKAQIDANKAKWQAAHDGRRRPGSNSSNHKPKHKVVDGKPMILNKKGAYVLDSAKIQKAKKAEALVENFAASLVSLTGSAGGNVPAPASMATGPSPARSSLATPMPTAALADRAVQTRTLVQDTFAQLLRL